MPTHKANILRKQIDETLQPYRLQSRQDLCKPSRKILYRTFTKKRRDCKGHAVSVFIKGSQSRKFFPQGSLLLHLGIFFLIPDFRIPFGCGCIVLLRH